MESAARTADACAMTVNHDARPASRYRAVTPSIYREATTITRRATDAPRATSPGARVLRTVPAQVVRIERVD